MQARADNCTDPERSLKPSGDESGAAVKAIKKRGYLIVGVDQNSYHWGYRDPNKKSSELEGFDIDLAHEIAQKILGDRDLIRFRAIPTNQRIPAIQHGNVDMVVRTMTISCERLKDVAFSTAYFQTGQQVLAPKTSSITGYDKSLAGKRICTASKLDRVRPSRRGPEGGHAGHAAPTSPRRCRTSWTASSGCSSARWTPW